MKRLLSLFAALLIFSGCAFATDIADVPADYWAQKEINSVVNDGVMKLYAQNLFKPEINVQRAEFNTMLLRTLGHKEGDKSIENKFTDINIDHWAYGDILKSEQLGLLYGYPDQTFKPQNLINKSEVASIISHITKDNTADVKVLDQFTDKDSIPAWATQQYAKSVQLGIYVNHPDEKQLLPVKDINRAEAAVILYKLGKALNAVKDQYVAKEVVQATEHLNMVSPVPNDKVLITNYRKVIMSGNYIVANFANNYNSKKSAVDENVDFTFLNDVYTKEGTLLIPATSILKGYVKTLDPQKIWNRNAKVTVGFTELCVANGKCTPVDGRVVDNDGILTASKLQTAGKLALYTAGGAAIGAGAGVGFAAIPREKKWGTGIAIGVPVGAGVGLVTGLITPGLPYKAKTKDTLTIELLQNVSIYNK